ncbi:unnamed protein product [Porites lobata]|uniref:NACHT domain-containing protein n=1 Tax=Porites lobata TaxID=104759 RepID=A0ABN8S334_9CNID|nr:unnamed protein product [Porites lobata]
MASPPTLAPSTKETTNYARLCRLLVDGGTKALRYTFDKFHSPANLFNVLKAGSAEHLTLQSLKKKKIINATQWGKLYPSPPWSVTSEDFDITLLMVLLRNICGRAAPATGWDSLPSASDTSVEANIVRVKFYRNSVYGHAIQASVDDPTFNTLWQYISAALVALGVDIAAINKLQTESMDQEREGHYRELLRDWRKDEDSVKDKLDKMEDRTRKDFKQMKSDIETLKTLVSATKEEGEFPHTHIEIIRQNYKRHEGWLAPFPWCEDFQFQLSDIYTRLRMVSREKRARTTAEQRVVETTEIFKPHDECKKPRKVLIEGKPGMGKTTYCNKVAYDWAINIDNEEDCFPEFEMVLLLKCRDVEIESDLWGAIDDQLLPDEIHQKEREKFFEFIRQNQSKVLLILDGLDELPSSKLPGFTDVIQGKMLPLCHLVVTARHEAGIPMRKVCDTLLEIEGFTYQESKEFIHKYFAGKEDLAEKLLDKIQIEKRLKEMTANPLNTALLCLLCEDFQGILPESRTQLYLEIVQCVLIRYRTKKGLPVENEDLIEIYKDQLKLLGLIALNGLYEDNMYFQDKKLSSENVDLPEFGFLSAQPGSSKRRPCMYYGFTHKSFQEFFAGHYLCCQLVSKETNPEILVTDTRYFGALREVLKFTCGLLAVTSEESAVALINCIANEVNKVDAGTERLLVAVECIKECKIESSDFHIELARTIGACLALQQWEIKRKGLGDAATAVIAAVLKANTTLTNLSFSGNNLGSAGAESLATALKTNTTLTNLDLSGNNLGPAGVESLATALKTNTTLTNLDLSGNNLGPAGVESLATALETNTTLTNLDLSGNNLGPAGVESLATALETNTTLTNLDLSGNSLGPAGAESLATALKTNTTLANLSLNGNNLGPAAAGAELLATTLKTNTTLTHLVLTRNTLGSAGAESLATALKTNTTLTNLDLAHNGIGRAGAESLATALKTNTTLTNLSLSRNRLRPAGAESLATALETNRTLTNLDLSQTDVGPAGAKSLATALETNTTLANLHLYGSNIGPAGAESLATALKTNTTLTNLDLGLNDLRPAGAESLATALKTNTTLTKLYLAYNSIGPAGAESLATALKTNTTLTNLDLGLNDLRPEGAESLATALKTNTTLTKLYLAYNSIGPAGAESLATALKTNTTLTNLDLSQTDVGPAGAESLVTALKTNATLTNLKY